MLKYYESSCGSIRQADTFVSGGLVTLVDPTESELEGFSVQFGIDRANLLSALDTEEPSRYERDETGSYLYMDVPYVDDSGSYDTVPLLIAYRGDAVLAVCKKSVGLVDKFLNTSGRRIDLSNRSDFQLRLMQSIIKSYQQALREIDQKRRSVHSIITDKDSLSNKDISLLHDLENSLVYITTSLKGIDSLLNIMENEGEIDASVGTLFKSVTIEIKQAVEMAAVYREIMGSTRELIGTEVNLRLSLIMKKLTVLTIMLTIPMIITGAYGMNVDLPLQEYSGMFWVLVVVSLTIMLLSVYIMHLRHM